MLLYPGGFLFAIFHVRRVISITTIRPQQGLAPSGILTITCWKVTRICGVMWMFEWVRARERRIISVFRKSLPFSPVFSIFPFPLSLPLCRWCWRWAWRTVWWADGFVVNISYRPNRLSRFAGHVYLHTSSWPLITLGIRTRTSIEDQIPIWAPLPSIYRTGESVTEVASFWCLIELQGRGTLSIRICGRAGQE